ncbi:TetR/AcrR family transcriptional regulator [Microbacterium gorillae]|uniref:TetR/AcrR family transcriptional regulator n=1 Tax=Microbacterium gorillae TaxID=1231063 RepID=UPI00058C7662|nr:TetR/AcrR family transcriptional regulator [Microbacterium gorillae]
MTSPTAGPARGDAEIGRRGAYAKGVARRQEILDRAIEVFRDRGASGTSLRSIAEALGVSHAALLHYFDSREQLLVAVYEHHERRRREDPDDPDPDGAADAVTAMVNAATANVAVPGLVELYTTLVAGSLEANSTAARDFFTARFDAVRAGTAERLRRDQAAGLIRADVDPDAIAALIVAASDGLQVQWLLDPSVPLEQTLGTLGPLLRPAA